MTGTTLTAISEMPEANYLVGHPDGPYYRLIIRYFHDRHRAHQHYLRSDEIVRHVSMIFPDYDDTSCHRHLDQLEKWRLIRLLPEQSRPANLTELRRRPRTYQAERIAIRLEELRVRLETEQTAAAALNPAALDRIVESLKALLDWAHSSHLADMEPQQTASLWDAAFSAFDSFARGIEDYLGDLPRHRPRESLDYQAFILYREAMVPYLSQYVRRLFDRKELIHHIASQLQPVTGPLIDAAALHASRQVRADGTSPAAHEEAARRRSGFDALTAYFGEGGDVDTLLNQAQDWVEDITHHARRLSEQHLGGTIREQTLLDLARRFSGHSSLVQSQWLAQVAFGATRPLHWRGEAPEPADDPWSAPPVVARLFAIRRGQRPKARPDITLDRTADQFEVLRVESERRRLMAAELDRLFGSHDTIDLDLLELSPSQRRLLLRLVYRALSHRGSTGIGYRDWTIRVRLPHEAELGLLDSTDGRLTLPRYRVCLDRGDNRV